MSVNQSSDFIFMILTGSAGNMHMRLRIVCNVISVELIAKKSVIQTGRKIFAISILI